MSCLSLKWSLIWGRKTTFLSLHEFACLWLSAGCSLSRVASGAVSWRLTSSVLCSESAHTALPAFSCPARPSLTRGGLVWVGSPCSVSYNGKFINSPWGRLAWFSSLSSSHPPSPNIRESDLILKPIIIMKKLIVRTSVLQSRQAEKRLKGPGKLRPRNNSQAGICNQIASLGTTLLRAWWAQTGLTRAMCTILPSSPEEREPQNATWMHGTADWVLLSHFYCLPFISAVPLCAFQRSELGNILRNGGN